MGTVWKLLLQSNAILSNMVQNVSSGRDRVCMAVLRCIHFVCVSVCVRVKEAVW